MMKKLKKRVRGNRVSETAPTTVAPVTTPLVAGMSDTAATSAAVSAPPLLRPPPGVAPQGRRLRRSVSAACGRFRNLCTAGLGSRPSVPVRPVHPLNPSARQHTHCSRENPTPIWVIGNRRAYASRQLGDDRINRLTSESPMLTATANLSEAAESIDMLTPTENRASNAN